MLNVVKSVGSLYRNQLPTFMGHADGRTFFEYTSDLDGGQTASGIVSIVRDENGGVSHLHIAFSPLGAVLDIAQGLKSALSHELDADLFV